MKKVASVIFRFSNHSKFRRRNLQVVVAQASRIPELEIIISVMHKNISKIPGTIHVWTPGTFESSRANNIGAAAATTDLFIFQDADILFDRMHYRRIIKHTNLGNYAVRVGRKCLDLSEKNTKKCVVKGSRDALLKGQKNDSGRDAPGGCSSITRQGFVKIGGFCEEFKVYGWEDCYYRHKVNSLKPKVVNLKSAMVHLNHESNFQIGHQATNTKLFQKKMSQFKHHIKLDRERLLAKYPNINR